MRFARIVLALSAMPFLALGIAFVWSPHEMAAHVGIASAGPTAAADLRAVYGGLQIACAVWLAVHAASPERVRAGLVGSLMMYGGLAGARFWSLAASGVPSAFGLALHAGEILAFVAGAVALVRVDRSDGWPHVDGAGRPNDR